MEIGHNTPSPPPADATQCSECEVLAEQLRLAIAACTEADLARRQFMESFFHESPQIATDWTTSEWRKLHERLRGANASQKEIHARWREHLLLECPRRLRSFRSPSPPPNRSQPVA